MNPAILPQLSVSNAGTADDGPVAGGPVAGGQSSAAPAKKGNWLTHLLPTAGSVLGTIGGGLLTGGLGGEFVGGAGGATLGKMLENALEGGPALQANDVTAGAEGGVGSLLGGVGGKVIGKVGGALASRASNVAEGTAAKNAAEDAIETAANTYKDISPQLQKAYNADASLKHVTNMGYDIADPGNLSHVADTSNDILNDVVNRSLANSGPLDLSHYPQLVKDAIAKESGTLGSFAPTALSRGRLGPANTPAAKLLGQLENLGAGITKSGSDPNEIRTLTTKLGALAQDAKPSVTMSTGAIDPTQRAIYNVINDLRGQLKDALYNRPEVEAAIKGEIGNIAPDEAMKITPQLAEHLNTVITAAGNGDKGAAQDLLDEISRNVNIKKLGQAGQDVGQIVTSTGAKARAAAAAGLDNPGMDTHPLLQAADAVSPHKGMVGNAVSLMAHTANNPAILGTLSRIGALGEKLAPAAGAAVATAPNLAAAPVPVSSVTGGAPIQSANGTMGATMNGQQSGSSTYQDLINAMEAQAVLAPNLGSGASSFLSGIAPQLQQNQLLSHELGALPGSFANAGGAQGTSGILSRIAGLIPGTAANTYQQQQAAAAQALAKQLGITPQAAAGLLPQLMQNGNTAGINSGILSGMQGALAY